MINKKIFCEQNNIKIVQFFQWMILNKYFLFMHSQSCIKSKNVFIDFLNTIILW